tara:strand:- start:284 stop:802 length:519 start_codon:yes stop_codon:yes gene_type:complete
MNNSINIVNALFLLFLAVMGNFMAETLSCQTQKIMNNLWAKHFVLIFIIYFTIEFTKNNESSNPIDDMINAIYVWILYHFFTHMDLLPTIIVIILLMIIYIISNYRNYLKTNGIKKNLDKKLERIQKMLVYLSVSIVLIGFMIYYFEKKNEFKNNFHFIQFLLGSKKCKSLK